MRLRRIARDRQVGRAQHGEIERAGRGQAVEFCRLVAAQHIDQREEGGIVFRLLAQQIETEGGLVVLSGAKLAKDLGLLPFAVAAGDLARVVDRLAGAVIIAGEQQGIDALAGGKRIGAADRRQRQQGGSIAGQSHGHQPVGSRPEQIDPAALAVRRFGIGQQQAARQIAHGGRGGCGRKLGQQALDQSAVGALPHIDGKSTRPFLQRAAVIGRHVAEGPDLEPAGRRGRGSGRWCGQRLHRGGGQDWLHAGCRGSRQRRQGRGCRRGRGCSGRWKRLGRRRDRRQGPARTSPRLVRQLLIGDRNLHPLGRRRDGIECQKYHPAGTGRAG